jgi:hypothetical protein
MAQRATRDGAEESWLGGCPPQHCFSQSPLPLEEKSLSLSKQDIRAIARLLGPFHQALRRLSHRLRFQSYFGWKHHAAEEMRTNILGQVGSATRAQVRSAAT